MSTELWKLTQYSFLAVAVLFLFITLLLAVKWDLVSLLNQVSGRSAKREIEAISQRNSHSGILESDSSLFQELTGDSLIDEDLRALQANESVSAITNNEIQEGWVSPKEEVLREKSEVVFVPELDSNMTESSEIASVYSRDESIPEEQEEGSYETNLLETAEAEYETNLLETAEAQYETNLLETAEAQYETNLLETAEALVETGEAQYDANLLTNNEDLVETGNLDAVPSVDFGSREDLDSSEDTNLLEEEIYETSVLAKLPELALPENPSKPIKLREISSID